MIRSLALLFLMTLLACQNNAMQQTDMHKDSSCLSSKVMILPNLDTAHLCAECQAFWVMVGDSNRHYWPLLNHASSVDQQYQLTFDSLDRHFAANKNELVVNDNSEDELYRGAYFPRRITGTFMSIEPYNQYFPDYKGQAFVEIYGIYDQADSALLAMKRFPHANMKVCQINLACMH
ncbi:MAG: hypothetical protein RLZZ60_1501 [Bacteroidota bacterium]|jgi:hypothetical protein